ncbi:hypothetical protein PMIT1318_00063 [Prochlorococcus marinus str. MIT 1318]|uniref:peptidylprolyl isomerase n=1 Tax=Prochlorococcus TaxID=1218 RepID=UPI0007BBDF59|nr:hypothetical protein [Prochlorococcus marinus]KZR77685.1 hypothetical protein PMIT1318_00063 [Prochlorococcus marinus str. MIT 1318]
MAQNSHIELVQCLALHELIEPLSRAQAEIEFVNQFKLESSDYSVSGAESIKVLVSQLNITDENSFDLWRQNHLLAVSDDRLVSYAKYRLKRKKVIEEILKGSGESLFLRYKDRLDRVLYSLIRVEGEDLAQELFYSIEAGEVDFGTASEMYSCGPESKTQGIVGPVDLTTPHPEVSARLRTAAARELFSPFMADQWYAIIRLEYRFDSQYDERTKEFLGNLVLSTKSRELASQLTNQMIELGS